MHHSGKNYHVLLPTLSCATEVEQVCQTVLSAGSCYSRQNDVLSVMVYILCGLK